MAADWTPRLRPSCRGYFANLQWNFLIKFEKVFTFWEFVLCWVLTVSTFKSTLFGTEFDPTPDRCKLGPANLLHMFWTCPRLHHFLQSIFNTLSEILKEPIDPFPLTAVWCNIRGYALLSNNKCNMLTFALCWPGNSFSSDGRRPSTLRILSGLKTLCFILN